MLSKHDNAIFLDEASRARRAGVAAAKPPHVVAANHPEFPLERLCSHRCEPFQLAFARNAQQQFQMREDVEVVASHYGLMIRGETEDAIDAAIVMLKDLYGPNLRIGQAMVRYHEGTAFEQPWMGLRLKFAPEYLDTVTADLIEREATVVSCESDAQQCVIQAMAPLATLLGYRSDLARLTTGSALHAMWLSHYAPINSAPPPDGRAA